MRAGIKRVALGIRNFCANLDGNTSTLFALAAVPMLGAAGAAVDYVHAQYKITEIQANLDAATLAGVAGTVKPDKQIITANVYFKHFEDSVGDSYAATFKTVDGNLVGTAKGSVETSLLKVLGIGSVPVYAKSVATSGLGLEPLCLMAMHPTRKHTLEMKGSVSIYAPDCNIYGNSNHWNDVVDPHTPQNFMTGKFIAAIGGGHHFLQNVKPPVEFGTTLITDPLVGLAMPTPGPCTSSKLTLSSSNQTLAPGHYCKGLNIKAGSNIKLQDGGTYFISGGGFSVKSSTITGDGVTVFLMDEDTTVTWEDSKVKIAAPKNGTYAGIAVLSKSQSKGNAFEDSTIDIHGVFYMPFAAFDWVNKGTPDITAKWSAFVVDGFSWTGSGTIKLNFRPEESDVPYPSALVVMPRPSDPRLVQ